jgi:hypothetical protein
MKKAIKQNVKKNRSRRAKKEHKCLNFHRRILLHPAGLMITLLLGVLIFGSSFKSIAASFDVTATVPAPLLKQAAVITSIGNDEVIKNSPLNISGTCPLDSYVKLFRGGNFSGSALCSAQGTFTILTDLSVGINQLMAQDYNVTDVAGPNSGYLYVNYIVPVNTLPPDRLVTSSSSGFGSSVGLNSGTSPNVSSSNPLVLVSPYHYQRTPVANAYHLSVELNGGTPPYTVTVEWGDGTSSKTIFQSDPLFEIVHSYTKAGNYTVLVSAVDAKGNKSSFQAAAAIYRPNIPSVNIGAVNYTQNLKAAIFAILTYIHRLLWIVWPSYVVVLLMTVSFWLGERQEYRQIFKKRATRTRRSR